MTGVISLTFEVIKRKWNYTISNYWYVFFAAICLLWGGYQSWHEEKMRADQYLKQLETSRPSFDVDIGFVWVVESEELDPPELTMFPPVRGTFVVIVATVKNKGTPSIADHWELLIRSPDGMERKAQTINFPPLINVPVAPGNHQMLTRDDDLLSKTSVPIPTGGKTQGAITFVFENIRNEVFRHAGTQYVLTSHDINGNISTATYKDAGQMPSYPAFFPGLKNPDPIPDEHH